jgi:hypothetical protein
LPSPDGGPEYNNNAFEDGYDDVYFNALGQSGGGLIENLPLMGYGVNRFREKS